ncbi:beta-1,3-glucanosyltransferase [Ceratobasidium sp. AG-Ba]|nr:beta-1,3-glucanosyltransferase [Ceratobasidium sp. AG-Ba]QRW05361.1 beta-1,3-glucanosyltransferase [Ceratobasidium sp. AG-Ba]
MLGRLLALAACALPLASALPKIHAKGKYLYDESGNRFYIKGVAYQEAGELGPETEANAANGGYPEPTTYVDPLALPASCDRDLPYLKQLGVNAVRVYSVNSQLNHDECMTKLSEAGIYTMIDLSLPLNGSINRAAPSWTTNLQKLYTDTIDAFSKYDNVLSYNVANEVINLPNNTHTAPFIKAAARDIKAYLKSKGSSALVGYSTVDASLIRDNVVQYLTCNDAETSVDIIGLNTYRWCGTDDISSSGYDQITQLFQNTPVPAYLSEFGCQKELPRLFTEPAAFFSDAMTSVWSGGVAFSYFVAQIPDFELVTLSGANNETVTTNADFTRLQNSYASASPSNSPSESSVTQLSFPSCPTQGDGTTSTGAATQWLGSTTLPPTPQQSVCDCLSDTAFSCTASRQAANSPLILGALLDYGCSLLGEHGMNCNEISENGATGTYGKYSLTKLNYVLTTWYQSQNRALAACNFNNNATINMGAPSTTKELDDNAAQCLAGFAPTSVPSSGSSGTKSGSSSNGAVGMHGAGLAAALVGTMGAMAGAMLMW